jgi:uncharacterized protein YdaU (DUF1376 family)
MRVLSKVFFWRNQMHYYQFNIGDYYSHTKHLSPIEDICYRRLLDYYYLHEKPLTNDIAKLARLLMLNEYHLELMTVLDEFFVIVAEGFINPRADKEIEQYQAFSEAGKRGAAKRWSKDGYSKVIGGLSGGVPKANAKQETITTNHKPLNKYIPPIPAELLSEWLSVRKKKKAGDVTELVWKALLRESEKLNWTPEQAVTYCCEKSWVNLDASWVKDRPNKPMKGYGFVSDAQFNDWLESAPTLERIANE